LYFELADINVYLNTANLKLKMAIRFSFIFVDFYFQAFNFGLAISNLDLCTALVYALAQRKS